MNSHYWIKNLGLQPHPEGGYFKEVFRSDEQIPQSSLPSRYHGSRAYTTSIYFLLSGNDFSAFHRITSDEIWHLYAGCSLTLYQIMPDGELIIQKLGTNLEKGERPQIIIPRNSWFAAKPDFEDSFTLVGCSVSPGFDFSDFELAKRSLLTQQYPQHQELIAEFTRM